MKLDWFNKGLTEPTLWEFYISVLDHPEDIRAHSKKGA